MHTVQDGAAAHIINTVQRLVLENLLLENSLAGLNTG